MRPTHNQEVIFEGSLEARVAAQLLTDAGRADLLDAIVPPIPNPSIGKAEFLFRLVTGRSDDTAEYTCPDGVDSDVIEMLVGIAEITPLGQPAFSREKYMGHLLLDFLGKLEDMKDPQTDTAVIQVDGIVIVGADSEQADLLRRRKAFTDQFLAEKGWDPANLSMDQLLEVRKQPDWQNPPAIS